MKKILLSLMSVALLFAGCGEGNLTPWHEGYLDIHQISTGRGNATFMILPD